jgi:type VI secretion system protein ImpL
MRVHPAVDARSSATSTRSPADNGEAIEEFNVLSTPDWPYLRLAQRPRRQHSVRGREGPEGSGLMADGGVLDQIETAVRRRVEGQKTRARTSKDQRRHLGARRASASTPSRSSGSRASVRAAAAGAGRRPARPRSRRRSGALSKYVTLLEQLAAEMQATKRRAANTDTAKATELFTQAVKDTEACSSSSIRRGQEHDASPLLHEPAAPGLQGLHRARGARRAACGRSWSGRTTATRSRTATRSTSRRRATLLSRTPKPSSSRRTACCGASTRSTSRASTTSRSHDFIPVSFLQGGSGEKQGTKPAAKRARGSTPFNPNLYNCLKRATRSPTRSGGRAAARTPKVKFRSTSRRSAPSSATSSSTLDGQKRVYRNEKEFWYDVRLAGRRSGAPASSVRGAGGLDEEIVRDGPWGIFRLFETAPITAQSRTATRSSP